MSGKILIASRRMIVGAIKIHAIDLSDNPRTAPANDGGVTPAARSAISLSFDMGGASALERVSALHKAET